MGILSIGADTVYTFRFIKLLVTPFNKTEAYKMGLIDENGKRIKEKKIENSKERSAFTPFHRIVFNLKKLLGTVPGGKTRLASYASALLLLKEDKNLSDASIDKILDAMGIDYTEELNESKDWFVLDDGAMSPGLYRMRHGDKIDAETWTEIVKKNDQIRIHENSYPIGDIHGINVYEGTHIKTGKTVYITPSEVLK